jgi:hypothetical protein
LTTPTSAELQRAYRLRQREAGRSEVRGIYVPPDLHARIKQYAARLLRAIDAPPRKGR